MKSVFRNYFVNILLIVGFTALALWFALKDDFKQVISSIMKVDFWRLGVVILAVLVFQLIIGWIIQQFAKQTKPDYKLKQGFLNALVAAFFHGITPSSTGGQFAQVYVFHKQGIKGEDAAGILILDFIVNQIVVIILGLILLIVKFPYFSSNSFFFLSLAGFLANTGFVVLTTLCAFNRKVYTWVTKKGLNIGVKLHIIKDKQKAIDNLDEKLEGFSKGVAELSHNKKLLVKVVVANIVRMLLYFSIPMICAWALKIKCADWLTMVALASFVSNVNAFIPIPGASGGTESTFIVMFSEIMTKANASSLMVLWRFSTFHLVMIIGAITFIRIQNSKTVKNTPLPEKGAD